VNIVEAMSGPFAPWFAGGSSWDAWKAVLKAAFTLRMSDSELATLAGRPLPTKRIRELVFIGGRVTTQSHLPWG
jgi:hypothetical protein